MRHINLLNGTCALEGWQQADLAGEVLVWHENYTQGILPDTSDITEYNQIRAAELHKYNPEFPEDKIFADLQKMHETLFSLTKDDKITLWFDVCPFDQAMEKRVMFLLNSMENRPIVELIKFDVVWDKDTFLQHRHDGVVI